MDVANVLNNIELPVVYYREGKSCYYDTYRKKLIEIIRIRKYRKPVRRTLINATFARAFPGASNRINVSTKQTPSGVLFLVRKKQRDVNSW